MSRNLQAIIVIALLIGVPFISNARAAPFQPVLNDFYIVKNGTTIFDDTFDDGVLPPSGPDGAATYSVFGAGGMTSETGGRLTMTPSLGDTTLISAGFANKATNALRIQSINPANPNFLGFADSFEVHGIYEMSNLPGVTGDGFGIRLSDRAPAVGNPGDNVVQLLVGKRSITGEIAVISRLLDFSSNTTTLVGAISIDAFLANADHIDLYLSKDADTSLVNASFILYDVNDLILTQGSIPDPSSMMTIYNGEDYIRGEFISTASVPVPEPSSVALVGISLAGLMLIRRRRSFSNASAWTRQNRRRTQD